MTAHAPKIWVLGAGQLGAMMRHAAQPLAVDLTTVDIEDQTQLPLQPNDVVTAEREQWPQNVATDQLAAHPNFVNREVFGLIADRVYQKQMIDNLGLATAPWQPVEAGNSATQLHDRLGELVLLKQRTGGFDGRGQQWLKQPEQTQIPADWYGRVIAEQAIAFDEEVSLVGVRGEDGQCYFYPLALNLHQEGILAVTIAPIARLAHLQPKAQQMLSAIMEHLNYVGVMAMECFRVGNSLMINELAPRVHNSGHWTQAGANISQFEYHVRATARLPLCAPVIKHQSVMINLIGEALNPAWWQVPGAEVFWYGKDVRPARKVGHINFSMADKQRLNASLRQLQQILGQWYAPALTWALTQLATPDAT